MEIIKKEIGVILSSVVFEVNGEQKEIKIEKRGPGHFCSEGWKGIGITADDYKKLKSAVRGIQYEMDGEKGASEKEWYAAGEEDLYIHKHYGTIV